MTMYIAGGAVRDVLLGLEPKDLDFVHTEMTPDQMIDNGYTPIAAASFPIFMDSKGQEHALARTEKKVGPGYHGFECDADPSITIEDDLYRRDLTINAMAVKYDDWDAFTSSLDLSYVIDPYNGFLHLEHGYLAPVSEHFDEDPVRVLRAARFGARYNFQSTQLLALRMSNMVKSGELDELVGERVWAELEKAMCEPYPSVFFEILAHTGAYTAIFKHIKAESIQLMLPVMNALTTPLSRIAVWGFMSGRDDVEAQFDAIRAPTDYRKVSLILSQLVQVDRSHEPFEEQMYGLVKTITKPEWVSEIQSALNMMGSLKLSKMAYYLPEAYEIVKNTNSSAIEPEVFQTLVGGQISQAIKEAAISRINYIVTQ